MEDLSIDEVTTVIEDAFDASIAPKSIVRSAGNKLHLMFTADGAAYMWLNKAVLALKQRFNPSLCEDADLAVTAKIVGTDYRPGKASALAVTCTNSSAVSVTLLAGTYQYASVSGEVFTFDVANDTLFAAGDSKLYYAISKSIGAFAVSAIASAAVNRSDGSSIPGGLLFSCADNFSYLGYAAETDLAFRKRIIADTDRDDIINEIESDIRALPGVYECNCVFNSSPGSQVYDGITLAAKELLVIITGVPVAGIADIVAKRSCYATHNVSGTQVVYYYNSRYVGGRYPVYFKYHDVLTYTLHVDYTFDSTKIKQAQAEAGINALLASAKLTNQHVDTITEKNIYDMLSDNLPVSVSILNVDLLVSGSAIPYVSVPKTKIAKLGTVTFTSSDIS
jgi:hypothetical protein